MKNDFSMANAHRFPMKKRCFEIELDSAIFSLLSFRKASRAPKCCRTRIPRYRRKRHPPTTHQIAQTLVAQKRLHRYTLELT